MPTPTDTQILFRMGGAEFQRTGNLWLRRRSTLTEPEAPTFSRADASTCATLIGPDGLMYLAAAGKLRVDWASGSPAMLVEPAAEANIVDHSSLDNINGCSAVGGIGATLVGGDTTHPLLGTKSLKVTTAAEAADGVLFRMADYSNIPVTAGTTYAYSAWVYIDAANAGKQLRILLDYFTGGGAFVSEVAVASVALVAGWQRLTYSAAAPATSAGVRFNLLTPSNQGVYDFWVDCIQVENNSFASSVVHNNAETGAAVTRAAEALTAPIGFSAQDITVYMKLARPAWVGNSINFGPRLLHIGGKLNSERALVYGNSAAATIASYISGADTALQAIPAGATFDLAAQFLFGTTGKTRLDVGSGYGAYSSAGSPLSFSSQTVGFGDASWPAFAGYIKVIIVRGLFTLADMQAIP